MKEKYDWKKITIDLLGNTAGLIGSGFLTFTMYNILKHGGVIYREPNPYISYPEIIIGIGGVSYFVYKLYKIALNKEKGYYLKKDD